VPPSNLLRRSIKRSQLVGLLAPALGHEKSDAHVVAAARELGITLGHEVRVEHVLLILDRLGAADGFVGVAARFVRARGELEGMIGAPPSSLHPRTLAPTTPTAGVPSIGRAPPTASRLSLEEIAMFVAPALGDALARDSVGKHAVALGFHGLDVSRSDAAQVLEAMSQAPGMIGVVATFAKARFLLKYPQTSGA
jgi:hypothetical protein